MDAFVCDSILIKVVQNICEDFDMRYRRIRTILINEQKYWTNNKPFFTHY